MSAESHETPTFPTPNHEINLPTIWTTDLWLTGRNRGSFTDLVDQISRCSSRKVSQKWFETVWEHNRTNNRNNATKPQNNNSWCNDDKKNYKLTRAATLLDQMPSPVTSGFSQIPLRSDNHDGLLLPPGTARKRRFSFFTFQFQHGNKTYLPATGITRNHNGSAPLPQIKTSILCKQKINDQAILYQHILSLQNPPLHSFWISTAQCKGSQQQSNTREARKKRLAQPTFRLSFFDQDPT